MNDMNASRLVPVSPRNMWLKGPPPADLCADVLPTLSLGLDDIFGTGR